MTERSDARARRPELALLVLTLSAYAYFFQGGGWNQNTRLDLVRSMVELGHLDIGRFRHNTGDLALVGERYFSDKAPGASWLGVPAYFAYYHMSSERGTRPHHLYLALYVVTLFAVSLPAALGVVILFRLGAAFGLSPQWRLGLAMAYGLGTPLWPYATLFHSHALVATLLLAAFAIVAEERLAGGVAGHGRLALLGALLGMVVATEYQAAPPAALLLLYAAAAVRPRARLLATLGAMALPGLALAAYHTAAFGGPFRIAYDYSTLPERHAGVFMGLGAVKGDALHQILFGPYRGLFFSSPWLLLGLAGALLMLLGTRFRPEGAVCLAGAGFFVWLNASLVDWHGGYGFGPRYLVPALPFLALGAMGWTTAPPGLRRGAAALGVALAFGSAGMMLVATAVHPEVPLQVGRPFADYLLPAFVEGRLALNTHRVDLARAKPEGPRTAWNLGEKLGLRGLPTLLPLAGLVLLCGIPLAQWLGALGSGSPPLR